MRWPWQQRHDRALFNIGDMPMSTTYAAVPVNPSTAMQHSAVWASVNLIAGSISTLPLAAYRDGDRDPLPALPPILRAPSAGWSLPDFLRHAPEPPAPGQRLRADRGPGRGRPAPCSG